MTSVLVLGATGLCGSQFLKYASKDESIAHITTLTRSKIKDADAKVEQIVEPDSSKWATQLPSTQIVFSGLGTTKAAAGSFENQYKVDHDLNLELAKAAKAKGASTYVLISSTGASSNSSFAYLRMKGDLENDIKDLAFEKTIILRPGPLLGERARDFDGKGQGFINVLGKWLHRTSFQRVVSYPVYGHEVGQASLNLISKLGPGFHIIEAKDILPASDA